MHKPLDFWSSATLGVHPVHPIQRCFLFAITFQLNTVKIDRILYLPQFAMEHCVGFVALY